MGTYPAGRQVLGLSCQSPSQATGGLSAALNRRAFGFMAPDDTFTEFTTYVSTVAGTVAAADITATLYSDNGTGSPLAAIEGPIACSTAFTTAGYYTWTGFTTACTPGTQYQVVLQNVNATPASNYVEFQWINGYIPDHISPTSRLGYTTTRSLDGGTTYGAAQNGTAGPRFKFSSTYLGLPCYNLGAGGATFGVYGTREAGSRFVTPSYVFPRAIGASVQLATRTGTPTGYRRIRVYEGATLVATSYSDVSTLTNGDILIMRFPAAVTIKPSTLYRVVLSETTQTDTSANRYNIYVGDIHNDATSKAMMPFGNMHLTYYNGTSWADTDTKICPVQLLLDDGGGEFAPFNGGQMGQFTLFFLKQRRTNWRSMPLQYLNFFRR